MQTASRVLDASMAWVGSVMNISEITAGVLGSGERNVLMERAITEMGYNG